MSSCCVKGLWLGRDNRGATFSSGDGKFILLHRRRRFSQPGWLERGKTEAGKRSRCYVKLLISSRINGGCVTSGWLSFRPPCRKPETLLNVCAVSLQQRPTPRSSTAASGTRCSTPGYVKTADVCPLPPTVQKPDTSRTDDITWE